jgi:hypothetical protein
MSTDTLRNSSRYSYYVDDALYRELISDFADLGGADESILDPAERCRARRMGATRAARSR